MRRDGGHGELLLVEVALPVRVLDEVLGVRREVVVAHHVVVLDALGHADVARLGEVEQRLLELRRVALGLSRMVVCRKSLYVSIVSMRSC